MGLKKVKTVFYASFFLSSLCLFTLWGADPVGAQNFVVGTVLNVDIGRMEIELLPNPSDPIEDVQQGKKRIIARLSAENLVINRRGEQIFPGCVYPGGMVRVWGRMDEGIFIVSDIRGPGGHGRGDPTGVRRRLQRMGSGNCPGGWHGGGQ